MWVWLVDGLVGVCGTGSVVGERAKRARRYLLMSMESRDIYIYIYVRLFLIPMRT